MFLCMSPCVRGPQDSYRLSSDYQKNLIKQYLKTNLSLPEDAEGTRSLMRLHNQIRCQEGWELTEILNFYRNFTIDERIKGHL